MIGWHETSMLNWYDVVVWSVVTKSDIGWYVALVLEDAILCTQP